MGAREDAISMSGRSGAYEFIDWLRARDVDCFVVSGTPQQPMRDTIVRIGLPGHFVNVFGSPTKKPAHYRNILRDRGITGRHFSSSGMATTTKLRRKNWADILCV